MQHHDKREPICDVLRALHSSSGNNVATLDKVIIERLEYADLHARALYAMQEELQQTYCDEPHRIHCASVMPEVFADFSIAVYLVASGLIVPARMLCRRALESGLAVIYMWDLPHEFWKWKKLDGDLNFRVMIEYLSSREFAAHISAVNKLSQDITFLDPIAIKKLYRKLSNTVHGKTDDLAPLAPQRYSPDPDTTFRELDLLIEAANFLICVLRKRFPNINEYTSRQFPSLAKTPVFKE